MKSDQLIGAKSVVSPLASPREVASVDLVSPLPAFADEASLPGWKAQTVDWFSQRGVVGLTLLLLDAVIWVALYTVLVSVRRQYALEDPVAAAALSHVPAGAGGFQVSVCLVQLAALVLCIFIVGGYDRRTSYLSLSYMSEHLIALVAAGVLGGLLIYAGAVFNQSGIRPSRGVFLSSLAAFAPLSLVCRRGLGRMLRAHMARSFLLVLGRGQTARKFEENYRLDGEHQPRLRFVDPLLVTLDASVPNAEKPGPPADTMTLPALAKLAAQSRGVVVIEDTAHMRPELLDWLTRLHYEDLPVYTLETFHEKHWRRVAVDSIEATWPWQTDSHLADVSPYSHAKRLLDIVVAAAALVVLSPLFAVLALLVRVDSGSPVLFRQQRIGRDRRPFSLFKFRTMRVRSPGEEGSLYTGANDPRITRIGARLRKLRLDELPQFWNVLRGDMSLIGPRAEWDRLVDSYEKAIRFYHFRHLVKPGITGWAQVNYPYGANIEDTIQKLKYDLYYIRNYSLRLDAMIVLKTLHIMIWGKGQ